MPRAKNPAATVADYFQTAPMDAVESTLAIVKSIVEKRRAPKIKKAAPRKKKPGTTGPGPSQMTVS